MRNVEFYLPIYRKGITVNYKNSKHTIEDIFIRNHDVFLKLSNVLEHVRSDRVEVALTRFMYLRPGD